MLFSVPGDGEWRSGGLDAHEAVTGVISLFIYNAEEECLKNFKHSVWIL